MINQRPATIAEAAELAKVHGQPGAFFREFLDEFYKVETDVERLQSLSGEPAPSGDRKLDAWYAAAAEHLCFQNRLMPPDWTQEPSRFLHKPYFPSGLESLKALCIKESPTAFRRRMIFVDGTPLSRPHSRAG
jgi:hypothetical protein